MNNFFRIAQKYLNTGHERSVRAKKNIALSVLLKGINVIIQLLLVPLLLGYLEPVKYGIWLTVGSVINWLYFFDIGLGNGLRNKLAEALARNEKEIARIYVSTSYAVLSAIVIILYLLFLLADRFINWQVVFNTPVELTSEVNLLIIFVFTFFSVNFVARLIGSILNADQKPAINDLIYTSGNIIALVTIYFLSRISEGSLVLVGITIGFSTFLPAVIVSIIFFSKNYKHLKPSFRYVKFGQINELTSLGVKFFVIQIAGVIVFTTDNFIITQLFGPAQVTPYNIALTYFNFAQMGFTILLNPFWAAFTEAFIKNDIEWITTSIKKLSRFWFFIVSMIILMFFFANIFYEVWFSKRIMIPLGLNLLMAIYVIQACWNGIFTTFINATGKIKISFYNAVFSALVNIPLSIFFAKGLELGSSGVILGTITTLSVGSILRPVQYHKIITNKSIGIWNE